MHSKDLLPRGFLLVRVKQALLLQAASLLASLGTWIILGSVGGAARESLLLSRIVQEKRLAILKLTVGLTRFKDNKGAEACLLST
mmetsp:Transcript_4760/g.11312  ORF Transcript_4760/g.11312 Transcript_4760/m.11312 type:complete len:85 (+) Transcript_4760:73-327(+)